MEQAILTWVLALTGVALISLVFVDAVITTLAVAERPGPLTRVLARTLWRGLRHVTSRSGSAILRSAGPAVTLSVVAAWLAAVWLGWSLLFAAVPGAIEHVDTEEAASFATVVYFTANTIVTTGSGDFVPATDPWRLAGGFASVSGLALVTLAITYLIPVSTAAVFRARAAQELSLLGGTPEGILARHWDGETLAELARATPPFVATIVRLRAEHNAFPVLHFFHSGDPERALAPRLAALDEALTIALEGVVPAQRPRERELQPLRDAIADLLDSVVDQDFALPRDDVPPSPPLDAVRALGIDTVVTEDFEVGLEELADRRRRLLSFVRDDTWAWDEIRTHPLHPEGG
jgi:hypothetical protein